MSENIKDPKSFRVLLENVYDDTPINESEYSESAGRVQDIREEMAQMLEEVEYIIREELSDNYHNLKAYLIDPLKQKIMGSESGIMSHDPSLETVVQMLEGDDGEDEY